MATPRQTVRNLIPDSLFLRLVFKKSHGYRLNLKSPKTFSEKLQWLKLHDRNPLYTDLVDKVAVKNWVGGIIGKQYVVPTYGVWENADAIDFDALPDRFVIKTNHDSGGTFICRDRNAFDSEAVRRQLSERLKNNFYYASREWPYKNVKPLILAERYLDPGDNQIDQPDYKVLCFDGQPKMIEVHRGRWTDDHTQDFYTTDWELTAISQGQYWETSSLNPQPRPLLLDEMLELSSVLSKNIPHVRVDWVINNEQLWFGEMTFYDGSGLDKFDAYSDDLMLGQFISFQNAYGPLPRKNSGPKRTAR